MRERERNLSCLAIHHIFVCQSFIYAYTVYISHFVTYLSLHCNLCQLMRINSLSFIHKLFFVGLYHKSVISMLEITPRMTQTAEKEMIF